jgi:hypothetical protein
MNLALNYLALDDFFLRYTVRCAKVNIYVNRYGRCA